MNLLKGVRYKRVLRREVKLWACMQRAFAKLEFDADMIEALGRDYGPQLWEAEAEQREAALAAEAAAEEEELEEDGVEEEEMGEDRVADERLDRVIRQVMEANPGLDRDGLLREVMQALSDPSSPVVLLEGPGAGKAEGSAQEDEGEGEGLAEEEKGRAVTSAAVRVASGM